MGNYAPDILSYALTVSKNFDSYDPQANLFSSAAASFAYDGPLSPMQPITELSADKIGYKAPTWGTDLFDKILINYPESTTYDAQNVLSDKTIEFSVWNTYGSSKNCASLTQTGVTGITLSEPYAPFHIHPFKAIEYQIVIDVIGPVSIDATFDWDFDEAYDTIMKIIGTRLKVLPIKHNWENEMKVSLSHDTVISTSLKLHEQRRALYPRARREISIAELLTTHKEKNLYLAIGNTAIGIPIITDSLTPVPGQGNLNEVASIALQESLNDYYHINHCDFALAWNDVLDEVEAIQIESIMDNVIALSYPSTRTWDLNNCTIYPMIIGIITDVNMKNITDGAYEMYLRAMELAQEA